LREIEEQYPEDLVVIGVHSGKYVAERDSLRIRDASLRYEIAHPIVNDRQFRIWRSYAVRAWPTLVAIDRDGYVVASHAGEFTAAMLQPFLDALVSAPSKHRVPTIEQVKPELPVIAPALLRYPGKVAVDAERIAISDTGNHRVLFGRLEGDTRMVVEKEIELHSPQGLAFDGNRVFVADSGTHTVYAIDVSEGKKTVLAGTGAQMRTKADRDAGALSSPWDVTLVGKRLFVAMAGIHQLWLIDVDTGERKVHCGTGGEDIVDGPNPEALLAQPMGLATDGRRLYFADAESSAIRWSDVDPAGAVGTIVGTGLFDFGDVDGVGEKVRMQHQQALALDDRGDLLVADSYNDAIKRVNIATREAKTWIRGLHEPGGIAHAGRYAYIADTNAHRIVVADYGSGEMRQLEIVV
jgi:sugar lactone lactonase YvrE